MESLGDHSLKFNITLSICFGVLILSGLTSFGIGAQATSLSHSWCFLPLSLPGQVASAM
jgi:hypothetical protein